MADQKFLLLFYHVQQKKKTLLH